MTSHRQIIDYRNASYHGQTSNNKHDGLGILLDDNLMFCIAEWSEGKVSGKCFVIFPDHRYFYGELHGCQQNGVCVYVLGNECYLYGNFRRGAMVGNAAIDFGQLKTIIEVAGLSNNRDSKMSLVRESPYADNAEKWRIIERAIDGSIYE